MKKALQIPGIVLLILGAAFACRGKSGEVSDLPQPGPEQMADINRQLVLKESARIDAYTDRQGLEVETSGSGLRWLIEEEGSGPTPGLSDIVTLEYKCFLLDGTLCYSSAEDGVLEIRPGATDIPTGLDEGVRMLKEGAVAQFIIPSYLGYGLTGDRKRIPARAPLHYIVRVLSVKSSEVR
jgi:FKBP-type peptidyl-prolyl cis-trans isomerase